jgi:hypothetical protein
MPIRSLRVIRLRCVVRALQIGGLPLHRIAEQALIPREELERLLEFGSLLEPDDGERLIGFHVQHVGVTSLPHRYGAADRRLQLIRRQSRHGITLAGP